MTWTLSLISLFQVSYVVLFMWSMKNYDYGDYDAKNMRPEKSRDLGVLGHFLVNFWVLFEQSSYKKTWIWALRSFGVKRSFGARITLFISLVNGYINGLSAVL